MSSHPPHPPTGRLVPLRTLEEIRAAVQTTDCYTVPIPAHCADAVLSHLRTSLPHLTPLQHLRRLAKPAFLPPLLAAQLAAAAAADTATAISPATLHLLVCPASDVPQPALEAHLRALPLFAATPPVITTIPVPSCQPISVAQASDWSARFWPTVYKRGNPYGPHPAIVENATKRLGRAGEYIALARAVGVQAAAGGGGQGYGCVVVDPGTGEVVVVAGDGRWGKGDGRAWGNPLNHCVMRAVAMVAQKMLDSQEGEGEGEGREVMPDNRVRPETEVERYYWRRDIPRENGGNNNDNNNNNTPNAESDPPVNGEGYLCHNMHIYLSHEPCMMCAMALLHSRVGAVVFAQRMAATGALMAEGDGDSEGGGGGGGGGERHGLFWRPELNWKFLCWQWVDCDCEGEGGGGGGEGISV